MQGSFVIYGWKEKGEPIACPFSVLPKEYRLLNIIIKSMVRMNMCGEGFFLLSKKKIEEYCNPLQKVIYSLADN